MNIQLVIALAISVASAATGFGAAWKIQNGLQAEEQNTRVKQEKERDRKNYETSLESQRLAFRAQSATDKRVMDAQNAASLRERVLRNDANSVRAALVGLSNDSARYLSRAAESHTSCIERATTLSELFIASADSYRELAEKAGRHTNDIQTLTEACNGSP